jgi:hypothetical protein
LTTSLAFQTSTTVTPAAAHQLSRIDWLRRSLDLDAGQAPPRFKVAGEFERNLVTVGNAVCK